MSLSHIHTLSSLLNSPYTLSLLSRVYDTVHSIDSSCKNANMSSATSFSLTEIASDSLDEMSTLTTIVIGIMQCLLYLEPPLLCFDVKLTL